MDSPTRFIIGLERLFSIQACSIRRYGGLLLHCHKLVAIPVLLARLLLRSGHVALLDCIVHLLRRFVGNRKLQPLSHPNPSKLRSVGTFSFSLN